MYSMKPRRARMPMRHVHPPIGTSTPHPRMKRSDTMLDSSEHPSMGDPMAGMMGGMMGGGDGGEGE